MRKSSDIPTRWLALWNGDMAVLDDLVAEDVVTHAVIVGQASQEPLVGREALGGWIAQLRTAMPTVSFAVEVGPIIDGDLIALRWRADGGKAAPAVDFTGTDTLRIDGDRIAEYWVNSDTQLMMSQLQVSPD